MVIACKQSVFSESSKFPICFENSVQYQLSQLSSDCTVWYGLTELSSSLGRLGTVSGSERKLSGQKGDGEGETFKS